MQQPHYPRVVYRIREKLDAGALSFFAPVKRWVGYGQGKPCDGCDDIIWPAQIEHELDFVSAPTVRLHVGCAGLYESERRRRGYRAS